MKFKDWSADFEIGIQAIDKDHQTLFNAIRQLGEQIHQGHGAERIKATIGSLLLYVDEHFEREERFMIRVGYPKFEAHKKEHDSFRDSIFSLRDYYSNNQDNVEAQKIVTFLENWLLNHILKVDRAYAPYLNGEKKGDPELQKRLAQAENDPIVSVNVPQSKKAQVEHFIKLITESSDEGALVEAAVEKITTVQKTRRDTKAKELFGK